MRNSLKSEEGFTFIEALIALMISSIILITLTTGILQAQSIQNVLITKASEQTAETVIGNRQIEWHLFLNQFENYLSGTTNPKVGNQEIYVDEWDEKDKKNYRVIYRSTNANQSRLTRYKNTGNEIMLTDIESKNFQQIDNWLIIKVTFKNGETYSGRIWVKSWEKEK